MANKGETVIKICDLIHIQRLDLFRTYDELAYRILSAHEREMAAKDAEIARLKEALKSVMEFETKCSMLYAPSARPSA